MMPSSLKMLMLATAEAQASGWPEYVRPPGNARSRNVAEILSLMTTPPSGR